MCSNFLHKKIVWMLLITFVSQVAFAEVVPGATQTNMNRQAVSSEVVPSGSQQPSGTSSSSGEVVPNSQVKGEVAPNGPRSPGAGSGITKTPVVSAFVGEAVVGVSMLLAYGPQIIALAATVAAIAASISILTNTSKQSLEMVRSIGTKLQDMLKLLLGPIAVSSGTTKEGVEGLSAQLLKVTKFVTNSVSTPVGQVQSEVDHTLAMSRDLEVMTMRGRSMAESMKNMSAETQADLKKNVAGGAVQLFRDGANKVASVMGNQADITVGALNQANENAHLTTSQLEALKNRIDGAVATSGKQGNEVSLYDIGLSGAEVSKQLIEARKHMVDSRNILTNADKSAGELPNEILKLLNGVKGDLETFAAANGVDASAIARTMKDPHITGKTGPAGPGISVTGTKGDQGKNGKSATRLSDEISFMVEEMARLNEKAERQIDASTNGADVASNSVSDSSSRNESAKFESHSETSRDRLYQNKVMAYKAFVGVMTRNPGDKAAVEVARTAYESADRKYREVESKH
ncbi:MAG: hypothetical protein HQM09_01510 [Candidatus Riflebacteria bacterium]|nr:hypothetical protein [Candidatus Riflebacteria bacterium]